ncbi:hypothetical protein FOA52_011649 [Chlamydomonas sp. UWO 241]|nr:hypothetical protein FOA52_011649 [Chlamydomonas sp. UWO 241]
MPRTRGQEASTSRPIAAQADANDGGAGTLLLASTSSDASAGAEAGAASAREGEEGISSEGGSSSEGAESEGGWGDVARGGEEEGEADEGEGDSDDGDDDSDSDEEEGSESDEEDEGTVRGRRSLMQHILDAEQPAPTREASVLQRFARLPLPPQLLEHELAWELVHGTASSATAPTQAAGASDEKAGGAEQRSGKRAKQAQCEEGSGSGRHRATSIDEPKLRRRATDLAASGHAPSGSGGTGQRRTSARLATGGSGAGGSGSGSGSAPAGPAPPTTTPARKPNPAKTSERPRMAIDRPATVNTATLLMRRDLGGDRPGFSLHQQRHLGLGRTATCPRHPQRRVDAMEVRAYIGQYSTCGTFFVAAFQDQRVRIYDVENGWRLRKDVRARMCRWTVTDCTLSPDQRFLVYASIMPVAHLVAVGHRGDGLVESISNVTEVHEELCFDARSEAWHTRRNFGIWSIKWSGDGREIIAGTNDERVYVYDVESSRVVAFAGGHTDDINAVVYMDDTSNVFASGSDDQLIKVWDRRIVDTRGRCKPVGVFVGHTEGLTHLDSKGDGRYLISNSKDQCIKLWDMRSGMVSEEMANAQSSAPGVPSFRWDYRWMQYPGAGRDVRHPHDASIATFRGHEVRQTLIRAYFSPLHTTGQRYVYSGGMDGSVRMWDIVTGEVVRTLDHHRTLVRDCSWHPYKPNLTSVSWDGSVVEWGPEERGGRGLPTAGDDAMADW